MGLWWPRLQGRHDSRSKGSSVSTIQPFSNKTSTTAGRVGGSPGCIFQNDPYILYPKGYIPLGNNFFVYIQPKRILKIQKETILYSGSKGSVEGPWFQPDSCEAPGGLKKEAAVESLRSSANAESSLAVAGSDAFLSCAFMSGSWTYCD